MDSDRHVSSGLTPRFCVGGPSGPERPGPPKTGEFFSQSPRRFLPDAGYRDTTTGVRNRTRLTYRPFSALTFAW